MKKAEENIARRLLWLNHGCPSFALYGDDGKMDCNSCFLDFKTASFFDIQERIWQRNMREIAATRAAASIDFIDNRPIDYKTVDGMAKRIVQRISEGQK